MSTLVIDHRGASLEHKSGALVVRIPDQPPRNVPLNMLQRLVIASSTQIDSNLLTHLAENGICLLAMPGRGYRRSACMYSFGHGDASRRLGQYQMVQNQQAAFTWARHLVAYKVAGSIRLLRRALVKRPDCRRPIVRGGIQAKAAFSKIRTATSVETLRGIEGAASASYFAAYRSLFAPALGFENRNRRPPRDPVNAALSLGYTLLHADAVNAIVKAGLDPMLGFLHEPAYSRESLACDLVEPARTRIDQLVWRLFAEQDLRADNFKRDGDASRMNKIARHHFYAAYEEQAKVHRHWFNRYAQLLAQTCSSLATRQPPTP